MRDDDDDQNQKVNTISQQRDLTTFDRKGKSFRNVLGKAAGLLTNQSV